MSAGAAVTSSGGRERICDIAKTFAAEKRRFFSLEFFPPRTDAGVLNLQERILRMAQQQPAFVDITWTAGGKSGKLSIELCRFCIANGLNAQMHLSVAGMDEPSVREALDAARAAGIVNILALRGDAAEGDAGGAFEHAIDLVKYIKANYPGVFCVGVAGYPEGHVDARSYADDIAHLAAKVAAGGDYVLTQHFFSVARFGAFVADARAAGVSVPIIPGLMPIHNYESFSRIVRFTRAAVPPTVLAALEPIATDDEAVKRYGIVLCSQMCSELLEVEGVHGVHFYTLNLEQIVTEVLSRQGFERVPASRAVPWQHARPAADGADGLGAQAKRPGEAVRPIFWANRPHSYVDRTAHWDEFPNGRWGDRTSPAFGELSLHHSTKLHTLRASERRAAWGHQLLSMRDVCETFVRYVRGQIPMLPWCELALANESGRIVERLALLNARGMLTINSQPPVDGAPSHDPDVGWGGPGGYVYQKAYVEMFVSPRTLDAIVEAMARHPSLSYQALDVRGRCRHNFVRTEDDGGVAACVCAVTWGVFPGKEIVQPTVVDSEAFVQWASEAFELWRSQWSSLYPADSPSRVVLERVHRDWWLLNVVDHDYKGGDLFALFTDVADKLGPEGAEDLRA